VGFFRFNKASVSGTNLGTEIQSSGKGGPKKYKNQSDFQSIRNSKRDPNSIGDESSEGETDFKLSHDLAAAPRNNII
jgi:hypothetical protein